MDREDERIPARVIVEHNLGRRVREDSSIPIELAINAHRGESWRKCSGGHDMLDTYLTSPGIEIAHFAGPNMSGADSQAGLAFIYQRKVDQLGKGPLQGRRGIISDFVGTERVVRSCKCQRIRFEESWNAV